MFVDENLLRFDTLNYKVYLSVLQRILLTLNTS